MEENTPTPINQAPATPVTPVQPVAPAPAPKKSMAPVIIGACVAVAALGGCGAYAVVKNQPTNVAYDAITNLLQQERITLTGATSFTFPEDQTEELGLKSLTITLDEKASKANVLAEATMTIVTEDGSFELNIGEGYISNGKMYLKVSGLKAALEQESFEEAIGVAAFFENTLEKLDGTWWEIDVPTVVDDLSDMIDAKDRSKIKTAYQCVVDKINSADSKEFADLYKSNQFVNVEKYTGDLTTAKNGGKLYKVSLDTDKLKSFVDGSGNTNLASGIRSCLDDINDDETPIHTMDSSSDFNATEVADQLPDVILEIGGFLNHNLRRVYVSGNLEGENEYTGNASTISFNADLSLAYPKTLTIEAPEGAKPIKEIVDSAVEDFNSFMELMNSLDDDAYTIEDFTVEETE